MVKKINEGVKSSRLNSEIYSLKILNYLREIRQSGINNSYFWHLVIKNFKDEENMSRTSSLNSVTENPRPDKLFLYSSS